MIKFVVGEDVFELLKKGRAQAEQIHDLSKWLAQYGGALVDVFAARDEDDEMSSFEGLAFLGQIGDVITPDAMLELYRIVIGCTPEYAEENFDVVVLIDAVKAVYDGHPAIRQLVERFFSENSSAEVPEESSTISE
jgi:hypothetical protein